MHDLLQRPAKHPLGLDSFPDVLERRGRGDCLAIKTHLPTVESTKPIKVPTATRLRSQRLLDRGGRFGRLLAGLLAAGGDERAEREEQ